MASYAGFGYVGCELTTQLTANEVEKCEISEATSSGVVDIAHSPMATFINEKSLSPVDSSSIRSADPVSLKMGENSKTLNANSINLTVAGHYKSTNLRNAPEVSCCENGHILTSDSVPGQRVCSCQYDSARLPFGGYTRVSASSVSVYGTPYASADQSPFSTIGVESTSFYSPLNNHYTIKDSPSAPDMTAWTSAALQPASSYYSYDPTFTAYGYGASYDLAARRKNATRESTATLKAWLNEHKKNPYPTKGEKIMLAIITKMTLTQVSTWFANARRRLKKENKMTWEPKNKSDDDDDAIISEDDKNKEIERNAKIESHLSNANIGEQLQKDNFNVKPESSFEKNTDFHEAQKNSENINLFRGMDASASCYEYGTFQHPQHSFACYQNGKYCFTREPEYAEIKNTEYIIPVPTTKPKIWSVADTVACKTPPPSTLISQQKANQGPQASVLQELNAESQQLHPSTASTLSHSPSSMPASYLNAPPYSRVSLGYESTFNSGIYNTELANNSPRSPPSLSNQLLYSFQSHPYVPQQHRIGFSEIQPDTPPQTPPNIKVLNGNNSSSQHQININQSGLGYTLTTDHNKTSSLSSSPCLPSGRITRFDEQQQPQIKLS